MKNERLLDRIIIRTTKEMKIAIQKKYGRNLSFAIRQIIEKDLKK